MTTTPPDVRAFPFPRDDPADLSDDLRAIARQRRPAPVRLPDGRVAWVVTDAADVRAALTDSRYSCAAATADAASDFLPFVNRYRTLLSLDPPHHTRVRRLIADLLGPQSAHLLRPRFVTIAESLADQMSTRPSADLVGAFTAPLTETAMVEVTGLPMAVVQELHRLFDAAMNIDSYNRDELRTSFADLDAAIQEILAQRRRRPGTDIVSRMLRRLEAERVSTDDIIGALVTVLIAGISTPDTVLTLGIVTLLRNRSEWERLVADPSLLGDAVEEVLRYCPPVETEHLRVTTAPVLLGGTLLPAGTPVLTSVAAVNRDPERFAEPDNFDVARAPNPHLTFGAGPHACPGNAIARCLLGAGLEVLVRRFPWLRLDESAAAPRTRDDGIHSVGLRSVRVVW